MTVSRPHLAPVKNARAVQIEHHPLGGPMLRMTAAGGVAEIALQGAQLSSWQPRGHAPVIWMSPMERLANPPANPKPVRGGTPVCWPWFANHPADAAKPAHGFVRTREWRIGDVSEPGDGLSVRLLTGTTDADRALWPHAAELALTVTLDTGLTLALDTVNTGADPFQLTQALHTYFAVGDIADVTVEGFDGESYQDKLDGGARKSQAGGITFTGEVDRIYDRHTGAASIVDTGLKRRIEITKTGSRSSVVWNPWIDKSARMGDMGPFGWRRMVCVETCNAGDDIVTLAPGRSHSLSSSYRVTAL